MTMTTPNAPHTTTTTTTTALALALACALLGAATGCDQSAKIGEGLTDGGGTPSDGGVTPTDGAVASDATTPDVDAGGSTVDGGGGGCTGACDGGALPTELAAIQVLAISTAAHVVPAMPSSSFTLQVRGLDALPTEGVRPSPLETFGPCAVYMGGVPATEPGSVDLGADVFYALGTGSFERLTRYDETDGVLYTAGRITPAPAAGTRVRIEVRLGGHVYASETTAMEIDFTEPTLAPSAPYYNTVDYTTGDDIAVAWAPTGRARVIFSNLRYAPSGGLPSTTIFCDTDDSAPSFTIPWRVFNQYILPGDDRLESVMVLSEFDTRTQMDGDLAIVTTTYGNSREGAVNTH